MNLVLRKIKAKNTFSFDNLELDLDKFPILQIIGKNLDEQHKGEEDDDGVFPSSNGAGKTSIYNIITEALYSKNLSKIKKLYIANLNSNNQNFKIEILYSLDGVDYRLVYSTSDCIIYKQSEVFLKGRKPITEYFESIIPFEIFLALTYMSPRYKIPFFVESDKYKKEFINKCFTDLKKFTEPYNYLAEYQKQLMADKTGLDSYISLIKKDLGETIYPMKELIPCEAPTKDSEKESALTTKLKEINTILSKYREEQIQYNQLQKMYKSLEKYKNPPTFNKQHYEEVKKEKYLLEEKIQKYKEIKDFDTCPKCGSILNKAKNTDIYTQVLSKYKKLTEELKLLEEELKVVKEAKINYEKYLEIAKNINSFVFSYSPEFIKEKEAEENYIKQELEKINQDYTERYNKYLEIKEKNLKIKTFNDEQQYKKDRQEKIKKELEEITYKLEKVEQDLVYLKVLLEVFSSKGLIAYKLPERLDLLNTQVNSILLNFTTQFTIEFKIVKEKIEVLLQKDGKEYPIENCSEGEYTRISLALVLALRNIFSIVTKFNINILFLDEIFGSLDLLGRAKLFDALREFNLNILLVSHSSFYFSLPTLEIIKENNKSHVNLIEKTC